MTLLILITMLALLGWTVKVFRKEHKCIETPLAASGRAVRWYQELENADIYTKAEQLPQWKNFVMSLPGRGDMIKRVK